VLHSELLLNFLLMIVAQVENFYLF